MVPSCLRAPVLDCKRWLCLYKGINLIVSGSLTQDRQTGVCSAQNCRCLYTVHKMSCTDIIPCLLYSKVKVVVFYMSLLPRLAAHCAAHIELGEYNKVLWPRVQVMAHNLMFKNLPIFGFLDHKYCQCYQYQDTYVVEGHHLVNSFFFLMHKSLISSRRFLVLHAKKL